LRLKLPIVTHVTSRLLQVLQKGSDIVLFVIITLPKSHCIALFVESVFEFSTTIVDG
jgi:hypothetical protein